MVLSLACVILFWFFFYSIFPMTSDFHRHERFIDGLVQYTVITVWNMEKKYFSDILL